MLGPIGKEEGEVVMVQAMVGPGPWLAAAVAAHSFFHLSYLDVFRHVLHGLAANLRDDWGLIVGGSNRAELVSSLLVPTFVIPDVRLVGRSHEFNDLIRFS